MENLLAMKFGESRFEEFHRECGKQQNRKIIIFGVGDIGLFSKKLLEDNGYDVFAFCDNDPRKQGEIIKGLQVLSLDEVVAQNERIDLIIIDSYRQKKIQQVKELDIDDIHIWSMDLFNPLYKHMDKDYIFSHIREFEKSYHLLDDELSRKTYSAYLQGVCTGDLEYYASVRADDEYYPQGIWKKNNQHIFVDVGAYNGNTISKFIERNGGQYEYIYALEPVMSSVEMIKQQNFANIEIHPVAASDQYAQGKLYCNDYGELAMMTNINHAGENNQEIVLQMDTIDRILHGRAVTMIKMDIEGSELKALQGAEETIKNYRPFLAICVYHKKEDLIQIIPYLKQLVPEYKLYLRHHSTTPVDLVLYCTVEK